MYEVEPILDQIILLQRGNRDESRRKREINDKMD